MKCHWHHGEAFFGLRRPQKERKTQPSKKATRRLLVSESFAGTGDIRRQTHRHKSISLRIFGMVVEWITLTQSTWKGWRSLREVQHGDGQSCRFGGGTHPGCDKTRRSEGGESLRNHAADRAFGIFHCLQETNRGERQRNDMVFQFIWILVTNCCANSAMKFFLHLDWEAFYISLEEATTSPWN